MRNFQFPNGFSLTLTVFEYASVLQCFQFPNGFSPWHVEEPKPTPPKTFNSLTDSHLSFI